MSGYIVYWAKDYVTAVKKSGDKGPLKVVYGSPHTVMPYISSVKVGDIIYPVTIKNGTLAVMARLPVEKIEPAFEYTIRELGRRCWALIPEGTAYYSNEKFGVFVSWYDGCGYEKETNVPDSFTRIYREWEMEEKPHNYTQEPKTCCAKQAASGEHGSEIYPREIPLDTAKTLLFGKTKKDEKPLKLGKNGQFSTLSLAGFVRKMSDETFEIFEKLF